MKMKYGWVPDTPDHRDRQFKSLFKSVGPLPLMVDLRSNIDWVYDQGNIGSCTGQGTGSLYRYVVQAQKSLNFSPSRLMIYYEARKRINMINVDSGAMIRDAMKGIAREGVCPEEMWPYITGKYKQKPGRECYKVASDHQAVEYFRIENDLTSLRKCLADGFPVVFGFSVYERFEGDEVARTGVLNMPEKYESCLGGHCVLMVGYNDAERRFIIMNSWGKSWGQKGFFTMPYDYAINDNLATDFWTLRRVE